MCEKILLDVYVMTTKGRVRKIFSWEKINDGLNEKIRVNFNKE